jgi:hypothetical protein
MLSLSAAFRSTKPFHIVLRAATYLKHFLILVAGVVQKQLLEELNLAGPPLIDGAIQSIEVFTHSFSTAPI